MEKRHKERVRQKFDVALQDKEIIILDIPDDYKYMDPELVEILKESLSPYLEI